jgi:hypothetical protein
VTADDLEKAYQHLQSVKRDKKEVMDGCVVIGLSAAPGNFKVLGVIEEGLGYYPCKEEFEFHRKAPEVTPQLVPVLDENGIVIDLIADTAFLDACREREDRYNERD